MEAKYFKGYYEAFLMALILSWLPFKMLGYFSPFLVLVWFIFRSNSGRTALKTILLGGCLLVAIAGYYLVSITLGFTYLIQNSLLAIITYGSFFFFFVSPSLTSFSEDFYIKIIRPVRLVIVFESLIGITQFIIAIVDRGLAGNTGDVVQGTHYLLSFWETADMGLGNQIFTINMSLLLLIYLPHVLTYRGEYLVMILGIASLLLALVSHIVMPIIISCAIVYIVFRKNIIGKLKAKQLFFGTVLATVISILYTLQVGLVEHYVEKFLSVESPKAIVTINSIKNIPQEYPSALVIGLGPGQFSSRAALIGTGQYIGGLTTPRALPFMTPAKTPAFEKYIYPQYTEYLTNPTYGYSTMSRPFHSMLSLFVEFGLIIFSLLLLSILFVLVRLRKFYLLHLKSNNPLEANISFAMAVAILTLVFISFFENYLEVTQAIFPGLIFIKVFYHSLRPRIYNQV